MRKLIVALVAIAMSSVFAIADEPRVVFEDRFHGKLADGWTWLREEPQARRLKDDGLEIRVQPGKAGTVKNALVRDIPDRTQCTLAFEVTITNLSSPIQQYEQAGITWYHDGKPVMKLVKELVDGKVVIVPGKILIGGKTVQLRLIAHGNGFTALYRQDGRGEWQTAAKGKLPAPESGKDQISLQCYDGPPNAEHWMRFNNFRILRLPER
jgi:hypothetical protein